MTLLEDLDALDRMVENGAPKAEIRSQIRVILNGVAALEVAYAASIEDNAKLRDFKSRVDVQREREFSDMVRRSNEAQESHFSDPA